MRARVGEGGEDRARPPYLAPILLADAAGGGFDVAAAFADLKAELKAEVGTLKAGMTDAVTYKSPTGDQYEVSADGAIDGLLARFCGLRVLPSGRRSIPQGASASGGFQWDARFDVTFVGDWTPVVDSAFFVYSGGQYQRPHPVQLRHLSPTKLAKAQYYAVLEYTMYHDWYAEVTLDNGVSVKKRHSLPSRLEQRLATCLDRFNNAKGNTFTRDVLAVVGVVGVVSTVNHAEAIDALLSKQHCPYPLLQCMYSARRFVFFYHAQMIPQSSSIVLAPPSAGGAPAAAGWRGVGGGQ